MESFSYNRPSGFYDSGLKFRDYLLSKIREIGEILLYSSIYLGFAAAGMAFTSCFIQGIPWTLPIAVVMFMIVFSVYNLNRKTDEAEDELNHERRFRVTKKFENQLFTGAVIAYAVALGITAFSGYAAFIIATVPLMSGILYSVPFLPVKWGYRRIKEIPVMKNIVVSFAWALSFSLIPVYMSGLNPGTGAAIVFLFIFCWTFVASVLPDIRDRTGDAATGVATIPVLIGVARSRILLTVLNILFGTCIIVLGISTLPLAANFVIICSLVYSQLCILLIDRSSLNDLLCDVISDGQFISVAGGVILVSSFLVLFHGAPPV